MDKAEELKKYSIMVVEDEKLLLDAIDKKLKLAGFSPLLFPDGSLALNYLSTASEIPDLIWLDYYLGDMTGDVFLKKLKEITGERRIPVLVVSNSASPEKVEETLKEGANKYVLKADYKLEDLVTFVKEMLN